MVERLSISLDDSSKQKLEKLKTLTGKSTSEIIRDLVELGYEIYQSGVDSESLKAWIDYLAKGLAMLSSTR